MDKSLIPDLDESGGNQPTLNRFTETPRTLCPIEFIIIITTLNLATLIPLSPLKLLLELVELHRITCI